jgi:class 3 adenylate cyclase
MRPLESPEPRYAKTADGAYIAYQVVGEGPVDIAGGTSWGGQVEILLEWEVSARFIEGLASMGRMILHDRRGTGLSSRNVPAPNLETRVEDLLTVLDAVGATRPVLIGGGDGGAANALFASSHPDRVASLIWLSPEARSVSAPDYPWGVGPGHVEASLRAIEQGWGTEAGVRAEMELDAGTPADEPMIRFMARAERRWLSPDVAADFERIWFETDVRAILPSLSIPTLLLGTEGQREQLEFVASLIPNCESAVFEGSLFFGDVDPEPVFDRIRRFLGVERAPADLDRVLATVLFTDIVESTEKQAALGDHVWKQLVERHHAVVRDALGRWRGVEIDTAGDGFYATFDGPARAIRCALDVSERVRALDIEIRAGIHTGECELINDKFGGITVSIGARVASRAGPSQVLISQTVKDLTAGSGLTLEDAGEHELKGVPDRWHLYRVVD